MSDQTNGQTGNGRSEATPQIDENGRANVHSSPEAGAAAGVPVGGEAVDLTRSHPLPPAEASFVDPTIAALPTTSNIPISASAVTTLQPPLLATIPQPQHCPPSQLLTHNDIDVNEFGHIRRRAPHSEPTMGLLPAWAQPPQQDFAAAEAEIARGDAEIPFDFTNIYRMPNTGFMADAREHDPAPFATVIPTWLLEPWEVVDPALHDGPRALHGAAAGVGGQEGGGQMGPPPDEVPLFDFEADGLAGFVQDWAGDLAGFTRDLGGYDFLHEGQQQHGAALQEHGSRALQGPACLLGRGGGQQGPPLSPIPELGRAAGGLQGHWTAGEGGSRQQVQQLAAPEQHGSRELQGPAAGEGGGRTGPPLNPIPELGAGGVAGGIEADLTGHRPQGGFVGDPSEQEDTQEGVSVPPTVPDAPRVPPRGPHYLRGVQRRARHHAFPELFEGDDALPTSPQMPRLFPPVQEVRPRQPASPPQRGVYSPGEFLPTTTTTTTPQPPIPPPQRSYPELWGNEALSTPRQLPGPLTATQEERPHQPAPPPQPNVYAPGEALPPATTLEPAPTPPHVISTQSTDDQLRTRLLNLQTLINAEVHTHVLLLHAILAAHPAWHDQPYAARSREQETLWLRQVATFEREFMQRQNVDASVVATRPDGSENHPMARQRRLLEVQMRRVNGLAEGQLSEGQELRLRRAVLEAQLLTLRAWSRAWRGRAAVEWRAETEQ